MRGAAYRNARVALPRPGLQTAALGRHAFALATRLNLPLVAIVAVASAVSVHYSIRISSWVVMTDELQYLRLGISAGDHLSPIPQIHGHYFPSFGQVYPLLLAPLLRVLDMQDAWRAVHALNGIVMASTAVPAYLLARDVVRSRPAAWFAAAATVVVPWMALSTTLLTEVAGYPAFMWAAFAIHRATSRPSARHDALALLAVAVAFFTRPQFFVLAGVLPLCVAAVELRYAVAPPGGLARVREAFASVWRGHRVLVVGYALLGLFVAFRATQEPVINLFGTYASATRGPLFPDGLLRLMRGHFDYVVVGIGVVPALLAGAWAAPSLFRPRNRSAYAFAVLLVTAVTVITYEAAAFNLKFTPGAVIQDRYNFFVVPLIFIGMAAFLLDRRRRSVALLASGAVLTVLIAGSEYRPAGLPYFASPDTVWHRVLTGRAWQLFYDIGIDDVAPSRAIMVATVAATLIAVWAFARAPRRIVAVVACAAVVGYMAVETTYVMRNVAPASADTSLAGNDEIDRAVPDGAAVGAVESRLTGVDAARIWWNLELWNKSIKYTYSVDGSDLFTPFPRNNLTLDWRTGAIHADKDAEYLLFSEHDVRFRPRGELIPAGTAGFDLWRATQPYRAEWVTRNLSAAGWATVREPVTLRLYRGAATRHRIVRFELSAPPPVPTRRAFTLRAGRAVARGSIAPGAGHTTVQVPVCVRTTSPYVDATLDVRGRTRGENRSDASWLGVLVNRIEVGPARSSC